MLRGRWGFSYLKIEKLPNGHFMFLIDMKFISKMFEILFMHFVSLPILIFTIYDKHEVQNKKRSKAETTTTNDTHDFQTFPNIKMIPRF